MNRALLLVALLFPLAAPAAARQKIAVLDIRAVQGVSPGTATILTAIVVDDTARGGYDVISQADVSAMIGFEKQKQMLGCGEDSSCLAEIGGALGVDFVLSGQVGQIGSRFHVAFQLLDARKAKVVSRTARFSERNEDDLTEAAQRSIAELLAAARGQGQPRASAPAKEEVAPAPAKAEKAEPAAKSPAAIAAADAPPARAAAKPDLSARPSPSAPVRSPGAERGGWRPSRLSAWLTLGGGAVLMTGGAVFGLQAKGKREDIEKAWASPEYPSIYDKKSSEAKSAALLSNVFWGTGAAATGLGAYMLWRSRPAPLAVAPAVGDGQVGLVAAGSF